MNTDMQMAPREGHRLADARDRYERDHALYKLSPHYREQQEGRTQARTGGARQRRTTETWLGRKGKTAQDRMPMAERPRYQAWLERQEKAA